MHAVIQTGGKQYRVAPGDTVRVELLSAAEGDPVELSDVLLVSDGDDVKVGTPRVEGATVQGRVVQHARARKIEIIKFRRRKHSRTRTGHRQHYTEVEITGISA